MVEKKVFDLLKYVNPNAVKFFKTLEELSPINEIVAGGRDIAGANVDYIEKEDLKDAEKIILEFENGLGIRLTQDTNVEIYKDNDLMSDEHYNELKQETKRVLEDAGFNVS